MQVNCLAPESLQPSVKDGFFFAPNPYFLHLENGTIFRGSTSQEIPQLAQGEIVFTTGMTGYEASLTDPSYAGQILVFTYPLLGNYGIPDASTWESEKIHAAGVVVNEVCSFNQQAFMRWLSDEGIPLITEIDTRELTKTLRDQGTMGALLTPESQLSEAFQFQSCIPKISVTKPITYDNKGKKIVLVDCGMKLSILRQLQEFPLCIQRVPYDYDYSDESFDGIVLSNGPGDPQSYTSTVNILRKALTKQKPIFGICLGAQMLALAAGANTCKLPFGHRGLNQPCMDVSTGRCYITSQNHGYAISEETLPTGWKVSFRNLNDHTVEGISHVEYPFFAVQFHPEAAPGPTDTQWLFKHFISLL